MTDFLDRICAEVRRALEAGHYAPAPESVREVGRGEGESRSLVRLLREGFEVVPVLERSSPSAGALWTGEFDPLVAELAAAGARALAIVCEPSAFGGRLADLAAAKRSGLCVLYKDFVLSPRQLEAARSWGADAALLILALFERGHTELPLPEMIAHAHTLGLEVVLEVFSREEFRRARASEADVLGINNRDLRTLRVDLSTSLDVLAAERADRPVLSESGVTGPEDVRAVERAGAHGVLVGTALLRAPSPGEAFRRLVGPSVSPPSCVQGGSP